MVLQHSIENRSNNNNNNNNNNDDNNNDRKMASHDPYKNLGPHIKTDHRIGWRNILFLSNTNSIRSKTI